MNEIDVFLDGYAEYLQHIKKLKPGSVKDIKCTLKKLRLWAIENDLDEKIWLLELDELSQFFRKVEEQDKLSPKSIGKFVTHIRTFLDYAWKVGKINKNALVGFYYKKAHARVAQRVLTVEEVTHLIKSLSQNTKTEREHRLMILLLYGLGLRTGELVRLNIQDIDLEKRHAYIRESKNEINRYIPIPDGLYIELAIYIKGQRKRKGSLFLTHHKKRRLSVGYVGSVVRAVKVITGVEGITPKTFRHSFATHMIERGTPIEVLASLMGHKTPTETSAYLHSFEENRTKSISKLEDTLAKED